MGYQRSTLVLEWPEDSEFSGLEVRMRRLSVRQLLKVEKLRDLRGSGDDTGRVLTDLLDTVGKGLLGWNLEEKREVDGEIVDVPVPAIREQLDEQDVDLILALVSAWVEAAAAVPLASRPSLPTGEPEPPDAEWASFLATNQETLPAPVLS